MKRRLAGAGAIIGGLVLIWANWSGGVHLDNWSSGELVGYNAATLLFTSAGAYLIYLGGKTLIKG